jgi:hypothetical protein
MERGDYPPLSSALCLQGLERVTWQVISHMTFAWEASVWSAQRCYEKFMRTGMRGVSYFYALEQNPGRDGYHARALWCDCKGKSRRHTWRTWLSVTAATGLSP